VPIAVGMLCAAGVIAPEQVADALFVGELALDGSVRPVRGVLPIAAWSRLGNARRLFVPRGNAAEAAAAVIGPPPSHGSAGPSAATERCQVIAVDGVGGLVQALTGGGDSDQTYTHTFEAAAPSEEADLSEVRGQGVARRALEIAATGGHNLLFVGSPGSGKTMLARRLPGILPPLSFDESLETTMVYSVAGLLGGRALVRDRPFRAPHHTVTVAGLVGGGPNTRPGEISLAHNGVLFLDALLEFQRPALEALRQPLEDRAVNIVRARRSIGYPADFMLVAALNPCPCGHSGSGIRTCTCSLAGIAAYRAKLSGPLLDRIDMHVEVPALAYRELADEAPGEPSALVRERVVAARARQLARARRLSRTGQPASAVTNARLGTRDLGRVAPLDEKGHTLLERAVERFGLSARAITRVRRVARTIADLADSERIAASHVAEALQYRALDRPVE